MKIYLVGMPGSGKSTLGRSLADKLSLMFIDLDQEIEAREGKSISEIFAQSGEDNFRIIESEVLREFAGKDTSFVMATGGGAPCFFDNMTILNQTGLTIYLDVRIETLVKRLLHTRNRPLLGDELEEKESRLRNLFSARENIYTLATIRVKNPNLESIQKAIESGSGINTLYQS